MILSDRAIASALDRGELISEYSPDVNQIQPASLDVRISDELYEIDAETKHYSDPLFIEPGTRYLASTMETVNLPNDIAAQLAGRSSIGRRGLIVHKTAGWIDPGFEGEITLELYNLGEKPVLLRAGERVAQLVFFKLDQESTGYDGQYQGQSGPTEAGL